jgi:ribosomal protein S18 acetylase RimI-like enzyme
VITIKPVSSKEELRQIKALQDRNLRKNLAPGEAESEGFLSAEYSIELLEKMHEQKPSIIAVDGDAVVGYALVTLKAVSHLHPLLDDLFNTIDKTMFNSQLLVNTKYVVVGQLCVSKEYRGRNLVQGMYNEFRQQLINEFDYCITDVAEANPRSLKAHLGSGFKVIDQLGYGGIKWNIVLWDWKSDKMACN